MLGWLPFITWWGAPRSFPDKKHHSTARVHCALKHYSRTRGFSSGNDGAVSLSAEVKRSGAIWERDKDWFVAAHGTLDDSHGTVDYRCGDRCTSAIFPLVFPMREDDGMAMEEIMHPGKVSINPIQKSSTFISAASSRDSN